MTNGSMYGVLNYAVPNHAIVDAQQQPTNEHKTKMKRQNTKDSLFTLLFSIMSLT